MTYCVGMLLQSGLVMASDSRTNAGVDHVSTFSKMTVWERPGDRVMVLLSAGPPIDLLVYQRDAIAVRARIRLHEDDPYLNAISRRWSEALRAAFAGLPDPEI